jgi:hypothetical protein
VKVSFYYHPARSIQEKFKTLERRYLHMETYQKYFEIAGMEFGIDENMEDGLYEVVVIDHNSNQVRTIANEESVIAAVESLRVSLLNGFEIGGVKFNGGYKIVYGNNKMYLEQI